MIRKLSSLSLGCNLLSYLPRIGRSLLKSSAVAPSFAFILLCASLSLSSASAQTRKGGSGQTPTGAKTEERLRRVEIEEKANRNEPANNNNQQPVVQQPHVRKTALTYTPKPGNPGTERPALTNDIVIISRAPENNRSASTLKAGAGSSRIPSIWPVAGTLRSGVGMRNNPFGGPGTEYHKGQDISAPSGTPIYATADGIVVVAKWVRGYGNGIYIDHGNGITTRYGHLSRIDVAEGQAVKRGQHIGLVGSTGRSTGPHLHYEVRINGQPTSPMAYLPSLVPPTPTPTPAPAPPDTKQRGAQH